MSGFSTGSSPRGDLSLTNQENNHLNGIGGVSGEKKIYPRLKGIEDCQSTDLVQLFSFKLFYIND